MKTWQNLRLPKFASFAGRPGPLLLIILDGIGCGSATDNNAFFLAKTPNLDRLFKNALYTTLRAHGQAVGMPTDEDMGNSEVGHNALGAGRIFAQGATLVHQACENGSIFQNAVWQELMSRKQPERSLHFIGLLSDGNVHSHIDHLIQMLREAARQKTPHVYVHVLLDGRDVGERSALQYLTKLEQVLTEIHAQTGLSYRIASGGGRMVTTMDRYFADWEIVKRGWAAHVHGEGRAFASATEAVQTCYTEDAHMTDQYLPPFVITQNNLPVGRIKDGDGVVFFNFRGDRAIEISLAFEKDAFPYFNRDPRPKVFYAGMMQYDGDLKLPAHYLVTPPKIERTISQYLCAEKVTSFAVSETQKFGHVTYFWNGNNSGYIDPALETYAEITSDKIPFDQKPAMKAREITAKTSALLQSGNYRFGRINLANGDMVGHTGAMPAAITACEVVDECVGQLVDVVNELGGITIITADHGNIETMFTRDKNGQKNVVTSHTLNPVPFAICDPLYHGDYHLANLPAPSLANVAATICNLLGYQKPVDYLPSLLEF